MGTPAAAKKELETDRLSKELNDKKSFSI